MLREEEEEDQDEEEAHYGAEATYNDNNNQTFSVVVVVVVVVFVVARYIHIFEKKIVIENLNAMVERPCPLFGPHRMLHRCGLAAN